MKKKFSCAKLLLFSFLGMVAIIAVWGSINFAGSGAQEGKPAIQIDSGSTVTDWPIDENGDIDFLEAMNQLRSQGITPQENAFIPLVRAIGTDVDKRAGPISDEFFERLGIERLPDKGDYFVSYEQWQQERHSADEKGTGASRIDFEKFFDHVDFALVNRWATDEIPDLATWLNDISVPLAVAGTATSKQKYYYPIVANQRGSLPSLISSDLRFVQIYRDLARAFVIRANQSLQQGDFAAWKNDVFVAYFIGAMASKGTTLVEMLVAIAIDSIANRAVISAAMSGSLNAEQLQQMQDEIASLPRITGLVKYVKHGERLTGLDAIGAIARHGVGVMGNSSDLSYVPKFAWNAVDMNEAAKELARNYDKLGELASIDDPRKRNEAFAEWEADMGKEQANIPTEMVTSLVLGRKAKGKCMGKILGNMLMPAMIAVDAAYSRYASEHDMVKILLALESYKLDNGIYPNSLDKLAPQYLAEVPVDSYSNTPFSFERSEDTSSFKLYSFGKNWVDDGGEDLKKDWPLPATKILTWREYEQEAAKD